MTAPISQAASAAATAASAADQPLHYLPVSLFGSVMGLTGLSSAWRLAEMRSGAPAWIHEAIGALAVAAFVALAGAYLVKLLYSPGAVKAEFAHPVAGNLFGTFIISLLLLPLVLAPVALHLAQAMWAIGTVAMTLFAWLVVDRWMAGVQQPEHATPAWIVPVVGLLDVPLAMPVLDLPPALQPLRLFGLVVGLFFAVPLFTLILSRLMFQPQMPPPLQPTLLILLAPFSVGMSTYAVAMHRLDAFAEGLYLLALFMVAVLAGRLRHVLRCCPFRVGWWAVSFPLASLAIAGFRMAEVAEEPLVDALAWVLLAGASIAVAWLAVRTLHGVVRGELKSLT